MITPIIKLQKILTEIQENELTKNLIIPYLENSGFLKVEFNGGPDEEGKDIVCWQKDKFDDLVLIVAQVKHFKFKNSASSKHSFQTVVNQLSVALTKKIQYSDKSFHTPEKVYLISSHVVDSKNLKSRFSEFPSVSDDRIKIIDGLKLSELLLKHCPNQVKKYMQGDVEINGSFFEENSNEVLLKALGYNKPVNLKDIYTDLDFAIGKNVTKLFFNSSYKDVPTLFKYELSEWQLFKHNLSFLDAEFIREYLDINIEDIELKYSNSQQKYKQWKGQSDDYSSNSKEFEREINGLIEEAPIEYDIYKRNTSQINNLSNILPNIKKEDPKRYEKITIKLEQLESENEKVLEKVKSILIAKNNYERHLKKAEKHNAKKPDVFYEFNLSGAKIIEYLNGKRNYIISNIKKFNETQPSNDKLKNFLLESQAIISVCNNILQFREILEIINYNERIKLRSDYGETRLKIPISKLFDTRMNFILYGEAGAGKTTTLQMYAANNFTDNKISIIWLPLSRLTQNWSLNKQSVKNDIKINSLSNAIWEYFVKKGIDLTEGELESQLLRRKMVFLFDGLDEAIKTNEWLPFAINKFAEKNKDTIQIIVTTRLYGDYSDKMHFLPLMLLPFTEPQRDQFIKSWFADDMKQADKIIKHFGKNKSIGQVVRNPLLTTTLCVLAEHKLALPQTEIKLYEDRLNLLTGYYDNVKNISARISTSPANLYILARKIAFYLHENILREDYLEKISLVAIKLMSKYMGPDMTKTAVMELVDPCNILIPMTEDGKYGFGHLKYQEHLAASEINYNRSINIFKYLSQNWWKETMLLLAQMHDDLEWLVKETGHQILEPTINKTIMEMISMRNSTERRRLENIIQTFRDETNAFEFNLEGNWELDE